MTPEELLTRLSLVAGVFLIVSGLAVAVLHRRLVAFVLGFCLTLNGAVVVLCRPGAPVNGWSGSLLLLAAMLSTPMLLAGVAWWRIVSGRATMNSLFNSDGRIDG